MKKFLLLFLILFSLSGTVEAQSFNSGLVGHWTMDGKDVVNGVLQDKSGNGNSGQLVNIATSTFYTVGKIGQAFKFDGVNDYVTKSNSSSLKPSLPLTVSAWVKVNSFNGTVPASIMGDNNTNYYGYFITVNSTGGLGLQYGDGTGSGPLNRRSKVTSSGVIMLGRWYHVAGIIRGATDMTLYINGVDAGGTYSGSGGAMAYTTGPTEIGRYLPGGVTYYNSSLFDDVRIYNRALSASEITQLYNQGLATIGNIQKKKPATGLSSGLIGHWTFDGKDMVNGAVKDMSGSGNTGNLVNIATTTFYRTGEIGQAFNFDGVNDYLRIPHSFSYKSNSQAISFWMYPRQIPSSGYDGVLGIYTNNSDSFEVFVDSNSSVLSAGSYPWQLTYTIPQKNKWYHVYIETVGGSGKIYINGVLVDTGAVSYGGASNAADFYIGSRTSTYFFPGYLDEVRIYNRALSASEVSQLYKQGQVTTDSISKSILSNGLIGYWTFDGKELINNVADKSGNGYHGNMNGFTSTSSAVVAGNLGQALKFDGVDDYVDAGDINAMDGLSAHTVCAWVKLNNTNTNQTIASKYSTLGLFFQTASSARLAYGFNSASFVYSPNNSVVAKKWQYYCGTFDNARGTGKHKIYINAVSQTLTNNSTPDAVTNTGSNTSSFQINKLNSLNRWLGGIIDEVRVYNRALSDFEILQLYNLGKVLTN